MNKSLKNGCCILLAAACLVPCELWASPAEAEIDGLRIGRSTIGSLFQFRLLESNITVAGQLLKISFDVQPNVDYALVTGRDKYIADIDLYVYHENGTLIVEDTTSQSRGAVRWRSQYSGTATAFVHVKRTNSVHPGSYAAYLGILEIPRMGTSIKDGGGGASTTLPGN